MLSEQNIFEQLKQIAEHQPVKQVDLLHKKAKEELIKRKWVIFYDDEGVSGYCLSELGEKMYKDASTQSR